MGISNTTKKGFETLPEDLIGNLKKFFYKSFTLQLIPPVLKKEK